VYKTYCVVSEVPCVSEVPLPVTKMVAERRICVSNEVKINLCCKKWKKGIPTLWPYIQGNLSLLGDGNQTFSCLLCFIFFIINNYICIYNIYTLSESQGSRHFFSKNFFFYYTYWNFHHKNRAYTLWVMHIVLVLRAWFVNLWHIYINL